MFTLSLTKGIYGFAICGLAHPKNLRICDLRINQKKLADLKFADSHTSGIFGLAIAY
jgi:hypothetical protein